MQTMEAVASSFVMVYVSERAVLPDTIGLHLCLLRQDRMAQVCLWRR